MSYISLNYYILVILALIVYYILPIKRRWVVLLITNIAFYFVFYKTGWWIFLATILVSYLCGLLVSKESNLKKKIWLWAGIILTAVPWLMVKNGNYVLSGLLKRDSINFIIPLGISFYSLQIIAYLVDVYYGKIEAEENVAKYVLFVSFFPQLIQGPIPRYAQLQNQLIEGHRFDEETFTKGFCYIIWGFFLKLVIADKAGIVVNLVFDNYPAYSGIYIWLASVLYSLQIYADFLACTTLAQGVSKLFGIEIINNFERPYLAVSIQDFWRRWHISLSSWLKDYIYIPIGGNRKGKTRKTLNLLITFLVSGVWHGAGFKFIFWGMMHACYEIAGSMTYKVREKIYSFFHVTENSKKLLKQTGTFLLVNWAWIIFRADSLGRGLRLIKHMFTEINPWILFNDRIFSLGLNWKEFVVLVIAIFILWRVDRYHESGRSVTGWIIKQRLPVRWIIYIASIIVTMVVGTYGYGFNAQDFIYGGF